MFCDDCLGKKTGVDRHDVNTIAWTLALFSKEFKWRYTSCSERCGDPDKLATEAVLNCRTDTSVASRDLRLDLECLSTWRTLIEVPT